MPIEQFLHTLTEAGAKIQTASYHKGPGKTKLKITFRLPRMLPSMGQHYTYELERAGFPKSRDEMDHRFVQRQLDYFRNRGDEMRAALNAKGVRNTESFLSLGTPASYLSGHKEGSLEITLPDSAPENHKRLLERAAERANELKE